METLLILPVLIAFWLIGKIVVFVVVYFKANIHYALNDIRFSWENTFVELAIGALIVIGVIGANILL